MQFVMMGEQFEQELRPLVKSFFQDEPVETEVQFFDEELAWPSVSEGKLLYCTNDTKTEGYETEPFEIEYGLVIHLGMLRFHAAFFRDYRVTSVVMENAPSERKMYRNQLARAIYRILSKETNEVLPWGILTGVRPTKLVYEQMEEGIPENEIRTQMKTVYYCSEEKTEVSLRVAQRETELLKNLQYEDGYSLYIGIPFCPTTCHYCSFTSFPLKGFGHMVEPYLDALFLEIEAAAKLFPGRPLQTVYIGGGTPTTLSADQLDRLIKKLQSSFDFSGCREFTVEAGRPDSITKEKLETLKALGVGRISINPQSMNDKTLEAIGRRHTSEQIEAAFHLARECGHDNINMDLIIGLTGETPGDVEETLRRIEALDPDSLTVHTLALKRAARLNIEHQGFREIGASGVPEMLRLTAQYAANHDYSPYYLYRQKNMTENLENVGYARYGKEGLYNILIMEEKQTILALGAGGSSKFVYQGSNPEKGVRIERVENVKNLEHYINRIHEMIIRKQEFLRDNSEGLFR